AAARRGRLRRRRAEGAAGSEPARRRQDPAADPPARLAIEAMPAYFALGFIALVGVLYALKALSRVDPAALATVLRYSAIPLAVVGLVLLIVGGKIGLLMMAASLGYPLWRRWQAYRRAAGIGQRQGQSSGVDTAYLSVSLDHDTGTVDGMVKQGRFRG